MANRQAIRKVANNDALRSIFQAALAVANREGMTQAEIASQLGVSTRTLRRWIANSRTRPWKGPRVEILEAVSGRHAEGQQTGRCPHETGRIKPGRPRLCIVCLMSNREGLFKRMKAHAEESEIPSGIYAPTPGAKFRPKGAK